VKNCKIVK